MEQPRLFPTSTPAAEVEPGPRTRAPERADRPRLNRQARLILERLRRGPARNVELARISLKYTGRVSEVRAYLEQHEAATVICTRLSGGLARYNIVAKEGS